MKADNEKRTELITMKVQPSLKAAAQRKAKAEGRTLSNYIERLITLNLEETVEGSKMLEKVMLNGLNEEVLVDMEQETFADENTGYEIYVTEDGRWIAEDDAIGEWVQIKG